jgi:hypothetical protein
MPFSPRLLLVPLVAAALALTGVTPAFADNVIPPPVSGDVVTLWTNSGTTGLDIKCMQVDPGRLDDFAPVDQYTCSYHTNQRWRLGQVNGDPTVFWLQNVASGKCLDDLNYSLVQGNPIVQYSCHLGVNQQWRLNWDYNGGKAEFQNVNSGMCLSVDGLNSSNYRRLVQNPCYGFANERFDPVYPF